MTKIIKKNENLLGGHDIGISCWMNMEVWIERRRRKIIADFFFKFS